MRKWALVSVYDKRGVVDFCKKLQTAGFNILSTGGTSKHLSEAGIEVTEVEDYTGFPEMMDGRVKTLHPRIHGGLLGRRDKPEHIKDMEQYGIDNIDLVAVNLYPFQDTVARPNVEFEEAVEMIDIGGPSMLRSAAKNHRFCIPVIEPADYEWVGNALISGAGVDEVERMQLAAKVFTLTAGYDRAISYYLQSVAEAAQRAAKSAARDQSSHVSPFHYTMPSPIGKLEQSLEVLGQPYTLKQSLRYGENPHQKADFFVELNATSATIAGAEQLQGKELSYNNIQDADAALSILRSFDDLNSAAVVAVKHMNPCGIGLGTDVSEAFERAYAADPVSIFGGIIAVNRTVDGALADRLTALFLEVVIAPGFNEEALEKFARKKNVRLLTVDMSKPLWDRDAKSFRRVSGGLLVQDVDLSIGNDWSVVTKRQPTSNERAALSFAWRVVKFVKSNAIVLATRDYTVGVGAGQMNRVGAAEIAIAQAGSRAAGSVLASDAFFPLRDTVDTAARAGVTAIIQPGGSIKDAESIAAADEHGIAMVFTGERHFLH